MIYQDTYDEFIRITGFDIETYIFDFTRFSELNYSNIFNFFNGDVKEMDSESIDNLFYLLRRSKLLNDSLNINKKKFRGTQHWELLELIEDIRVKLSTIIQLPKYLRSSKSLTSYNQLSEYDYVLRYNDTLELVSKNINKSNDYDDDWVPIAMRNQLFETDYNVSGGKKIILSTPPNDSIFVQTVVGDTSGIRINGKDIHRKIEFVNDDLRVLDYDETIKQSIEILLNLLRGDVPEFPNFGVDQSLIIGTNAASLTYVSLIRQLNEVFSTDDTISSIEIASVNLVDYNVALNVNVYTRYNEVYNKTLKS